MGTSNTKEDSMRILNAALDIADGACRSDIECNALGSEIDGNVVYDLNRAETYCRVDPEADLDAVKTAQRAARYIKLRGDVFPWRMVEAGAEHLVRFENKAVRP